MLPVLFFKIKQSLKSLNFKKMEFQSKNNRIELNRIVFIRGQELK